MIAAFEGVEMIVAVVEAVMEAEGRVVLLMQMEDKSEESCSSVAPKVEDDGDHDE